METKITFNKPAYRTYVAGLDVDGMQVHIVGNAVHLKLVKQVAGPNVGLIELGERGGISVTFTGDTAKVVAETMRNPDNPYFMLSRSGVDTLIPHPFSGPGKEPSRNEPSARLWLKEAPRPLSLHLVHSMQSSSAVDFAKELREAKDILAEHARQKKIGRPPVEVTEARQKIELFEALVMDILDLGDLRRAHHLLGRFLARGIIGTIFDAGVNDNEALANAKSQDDATTGGPNEPRHGRKLGKRGDSRLRLRRAR